MLARRYRYQKHLEESFFVQTTPVNFAWGRLYYQPLDCQWPEFVLIAPKKQLSKSVDRHRAKRKMARVLKTIISDLPAGCYGVAMSARVLEIEDEKIKRQWQWWSQREQRQSARSVVE